MPDHPQNLVLEGDVANIPFVTGVRKRGGLNVML